MKITITEPRELAGVWVREDTPPPERQPIVVTNAQLSNASGSYQPFSGDEIALQTADGWKLYYLLTGEPIGITHQRVERGAVNDHFCWLGGGDYARVVGEYVEIISGGNLVKQMQADGGGQLRTGTSGGRPDPHVLVYDSSKDRTVAVLRFQHDQFLDRWNVPARFGRLHQCQQLEDGYLFAPTAEQDQSWYVRFDGTELRRLETPEGEPPVQSWSHSCVDGNRIVYACTRGKDAGWVMLRTVDRDGLPREERRLFHADETQELYGVDDWIWYQHGHINGDKLLYSALRVSRKVNAVLANIANTLGLWPETSSNSHLLRRKNKYLALAFQVADQPAESGVLLYDIRTGEHRLLEREIIHPAQWGSWVNPCLHQDHSWYAYQRGRDVVITPLKG